MMKSSVPEEVLQKFGLKGVHPVADLFPLMSGREFDDLCFSIKERGLLMAIEVNKNDILLDGRNRLLAVVRTGAKLYVHTSVFEDEVSLIVDMNLHRRHLDLGQRAMIAGELVNIPHGGDRKKQRANLPLVQTSVELAAKQMQVSPRAVKMARAVRKNAAPEVIAKVERGKMTLNAAHETIKAVSPEREITTEKLLAASQARKLDASYRKDLTDEIADDVRAALEAVWKKWCNDDPSVDWNMFMAAVARFSKTGVVITGSKNQ